MPHLKTTLRARREPPAQPKNQPDKRVILVLPDAPFEGEHRSGQHQDGEAGEKGEIGRDAANPRTFKKDGF